MVTDSAVFRDWPTQPDRYLGIFHPAASGPTYCGHSHLILLFFSFVFSEKSSLNLLVQSKKLHEEP